jgi:hypothetical protein
MDQGLDSKTICLQLRHREKACESRSGLNGLQVSEFRSDVRVRFGDILDGGIINQGHWSASK